MSQENVEVVRSLAEAFRQRDHERVFQLYDPDIEWDASRQAALMSDVASVYHGHEGVRSFWRTWLSSWRDLEFEVEDVRSAGDNVVMLIRNQRQWGRNGGVLTELPPYGWIFTFRNRRIVRVRMYPDHMSALKDAGLSE